MKYHDFHGHFTYSVRLRLASQRVLDLRSSLLVAYLSGRHSQVGSLAGAAHLLNDNAGVLRCTQEEQKSSVDYKGKSLLDFDFQYEYKLRKHGLSILLLLKVLS